MLLTLVYIFIYLTILFIGLYAWYKIWFNQEYCALPAAQDEYGRQNSDNLYSTNNISEFAKRFRSILWRLKPNYWISACGLDGYCYMYWQR